MTSKKRLLCFKMVTILNLSNNSSYYFVMSNKLRSFYLSLTVTCTIITVHIEAYDKSQLSTK